MPEGSNEGEVGATLPAARLDVHSENHDAVPARRLDPREVEESVDGAIGDLEQRLVGESLDRLEGTADLLGQRAGVAGPIAVVETGRVIGLSSGPFVVCSCRRG
jgi:hypothetical protein